MRFGRTDASGDIGDSSANAVKIEELMKSNENRVLVCYRTTISI